jgi:hypothetical protein
MVLPVRRRGTDVLQYIELSEHLAPFLGGVSEQSPPRLFLPSAGAGFFADKRDHHFCRSRALVRFGWKAVIGACAVRSRGFVETENLLKMAGAVTSEAASSQVLTR